MKWLLLIGLGLVLVFLAPIELNTYDKETEIVIILGKASYTPYQDEYEKMLYPTVRITTPSGTGSGVVIDVTKVTTVTKVTGCYIITAAHVVRDETIVNIELYNSAIITGTVVITDTTKDLALLRIIPPSPFDKGGERGIYSARLAPKDYTPYLFAPVWAVGCSLGLEPRPSFGHITAISRQKTVDSKQGNSTDYCPLTTDYSLLEISAPVLPGNSGGPVYDARTFEVIGIAVWVKVYQYQLVTTMAGIVPINQIYEFLEHNNIMKARLR